MGRGGSSPEERGEARGEHGKHGKYQDNYEQVQPRARADRASLKLRLNKRTRMYVCSLALRNYAILSRHFPPVATAPPRIYVKDHLRQTG